jgi:acetyl-CoA carboxylase biotin carboxyl carrier protein
MFKFEEICELVRLVASSGVSAVEIEHAGSRLRIDGTPPVQVVEGAREASASAAAERNATESPPQPAAAGGGTGLEAPAAADDGLHFVTSPIVGTFYRAPNPDADPYVAVGDRVGHGQVLCIVEAMKLMNEIESDVAGTIVKVLPDNAEPVEYGERLFAIQPD